MTVEWPDWLGFGLFLTFALGSLGIGGVAASGHHIAYWLAYLIAAVLVFGGCAIADCDWAEE